MGRKPCCSKNGVKKGAWTASEDKMLTDYITIHGEGKWRDIPKLSGLQRCGKSCRLRWLNYLRPGIKRGNISSDEEDLIIRLHKLLGNRWSLIAGRIPGRTDNEIKNYWNTHLAKKPQPSVTNFSPVKVAILDTTLPKPADTTLLCTPTDPSSTVRNHDMNSAKSNYFEACPAPVSWSNEHEFQQDFSYLDLEMCDISVSGEDFDSFFSNFDDTVHTDSETSSRTKKLDDLTDTLENWTSGCIENDDFESSASLIGSQAAERTAIEDWLRSILH